MMHPLFLTGRDESTKRPSTVLNFKKATFEEIANHCDRIVSFMLFVIVIVFHHHFKSLRRVAQDYENWRIVENLSIDLIHIFKIRGAKTEVFCCLRFYIFDTKILFYVKSSVLKQISIFVSVRIHFRLEITSILSYNDFDGELRCWDKN